MSISALPLAPARRLVAILPAAAVVFLLGAEADSAWRVLRSPAGFTARDAKTEVLIFALAAAAIAVMSLTGTKRSRSLAVTAPTVLAAGVLLATATLGGKALAMAGAILTMTALWYVGGHLLRLIGAAQLADRAVVAWLAGLGPLCLLTLLLGRLSLLKWWTMGACVVALGVLGCMRAAHALWANRGVIHREVTGSSVAAASAGVIALTFAAAAIYTAAPEVQFDALYAKAYLPALWAHTGTIGPLTNHIQLNIAGWFQLIATWGHLLGASATGRYLQLLGLGAAGAVLWSWGRRFGSLGPLAAVVVVTAPALFWQASTAYDDLLLGIAAFALTVAVFGALQPQFVATDRAAGLALGLMVGTCASLKTHLIPLAFALLVGWMVAGRRRAVIVRRLGYGVVGAVITAVPPLALRWIDTGNPVFPAYNNIFKSPYWLAVNEKLNFPFWPNAGTLGPIKALWDSLFHPVLMADIAPPGAYGVLIGVFLIVLVVGWRYRRRATGLFLLWIAIVLATAAWWEEFRYLRYLLPEAFAGMVLLLVALRPFRPTVIWRRALTGAVAVAAATSFTVSVAQFFNVPNRRLPISAAVGHWAAADYLDAALPEREALLAFNRLAPARAHVVTDAFERDWLTGGRDLYATWELTDLLKIHGPVPTNSGAVYPRVRAQGVGWALVSAANSAPTTATWLPGLLRAHGRLLFAASGWQLYQLTAERPPPPAPLASCDRAQAGIAGCWKSAPAPGGAEVLIRTVSLCEGELIAALVSEKAAGHPATVVIHFLQAANPREEFAPGATIPGEIQTVSATTPAGVREAIITVGPIDGTSLTGARLVRLGPACSR